MLFKQFQRLHYLNRLIQHKATGTPKELASKLGITERAWYKIRDELINDLNLPIDYCPYRRSYVYTQEGTLEIGFRKLSTTEMEKRTGGSIEKIIKSFFPTELLVQSYPLTLFHA